MVFPGVLPIHLSELLLLFFPLQDGRTALLVASQKGHEVVVEALLKAGATVDMQHGVLLSVVYFLYESLHMHPTGHYPFHMH